MGVMPMFPLGTVLLPGAVLPLQVFEPRYLQMVRDILADDVNGPEFGVVMIERGREVGGGDERSSVGTVARIVDIKALPDGRYGLVAVGSERIRVVAWLPDDPYPAADVEPWPDDDIDTADVDAIALRIDDLHEQVRSLNAELRTLGRVTPPHDAEISADPRLAVYHLGSLAPLGPADRQRLLLAPTLSQRLGVLAQALDDAEAVVRFHSS